MLGNIKNEYEKVLMRVKILNIWREYFCRLLRKAHASNANLRENIDVRECYCNFHRRIRIKEVRKVLRKMMSGKAVGQD